MTKILVDVMPKKAEECPFAEYIYMDNNHKCTLKSGMYSMCYLDQEITCDKLTDGKETFELNIDDNQFKAMMKNLKLVREINNRLGKEIIE